MIKISNGIDKMGIFDKIEGAQVSKMIAPLPYSGGEESPNTDGFISSRNRDERAARDSR